MTRSDPLCLPIGLVTIGVCPLAAQTDPLSTIVATLRVHVTPNGINFTLVTPVTATTTGGRIV